MRSTGLRIENWNCRCHPCSVGSNSIALISLEKVSDLSLLKKKKKKEVGRALFP